MRVTFKRITNYGTTIMATSTHITGWLLLLCHSTCLCLPCLKCVAVCVRVRVCLVVCVVVYASLAMCWNCFKKLTLNIIAFCLIFTEQLNVQVCACVCVRAVLLACMCPSAWYAFVCCKHDTMSYFLSLSPSGSSSSYRSLWRVLCAAEMSTVATLTIKAQEVPLCITHNKCV